MVRSARLEVSTIKFSSPDRFEYLVIDNSGLIHEDQFSIPYRGHRIFWLAPRTQSAYVRFAKKKLVFPAPTHPNFPRMRRFVSIQKS
jgi:hypothetical protein